MGAPKCTRLMLTDDFRLFPREVSVHGYAPDLFEAHFGFEPDCNEHTNFKAIFSKKKKKKARVAILQMWYVKQVGVSTKFFPQ